MNMIAATQEANASATRDQGKPVPILEANLNDTHMIVSDLEVGMSNLENRLRRVLDPNQMDNAIGSKPPSPVETRLVDEVQTVNIRLRTLIEQANNLMNRLHV